MPNLPLELKVEPGRSNVVPTITVEDHDGPKPLVKAKDAPESPQDVQDDAAANEIPGAMPTDPAPAIPDWYRVGWRQVSGIDSPPPTEGEEKDRNILELFLSEQFYGDWYHNAAVIVFVRFIRSSRIYHLF